MFLSVLMQSFDIFQYHITKLSEKTDEEMEQNENKDIEQALQDLEGSLGASSVSNKVLTCNCLSFRSSMPTWVIFSSV